eukprot:6173681-Pleurochrysis_carterae.AAC.2
MAFDWQQTIQLQSTGSFVFEHPVTDMLRVCNDGEVPAQMLANGMFTFSWAMRMLLPRWLYIHTRA